LQEQIERESLAIVVNTTKLTAGTLAKALMLIAEKIKESHEAGQAPHGKQSVKKLMNHNVATNTISLDGGKKETALFDSIARKYNIDYAFHQTEPNKYLLFFKSNQADAITACFSEYSKCVMEKSAVKPSIMTQLHKFAELIKSRSKESKPLERVREVMQHER